MVKIRKSVLLLLVVTVLAGAAVAQPVFDAMYFVRGTVARNGAPNPVDGRTVVFYESYPTGIRARVGVAPTPSGQYLINIFDDENFRPVEGRTYYVAVEQNPLLDTWGADQVPVTLTAAGWNLADLTLTEGGGPGGGTEGPDDGLINNTTITMLPDRRIRLNWAYNGATGARIWRQTAGTNDRYMTDPMLFTEVAGPFTLAQTEWFDSGAFVGDGNTFYYRVVPNTAAQPDILTRANNCRTVAKIDLALGEEFNSLCHPFNVANINMPTMLGNQLEEGDQIHWWDQGEQEYRWATKLPSGAWSQEHNFQLGEGMMVYIDPADSGPARSVDLTMVGIVDNFIAGLTFDLGNEYTYIGYPYPIVRNASVNGMRPLGEDQLHRWLQPVQAFEWTTYSAGWSDISITTFAVGEGKFYYVPPGESSTNSWEPVF